MFELAAVSTGAGESLGTAWIFVIGASIVAVCRLLVARGEQRERQDLIKRNMELQRRAAEMEARLAHDEEKEPGRGSAVGRLFVGMFRAIGILVVVVIALRLLGLL